MTRTPLFMSLILASAAALPARAADLVVHVDNVKTADGQVMVALFDRAGDFLKRPARTACAPANVGATTVVFKDVAPGDYGFAVFHDRNDNKRMDANPMGIPIEPIAFSNDAQGHMGPPAFDAARFTVPAAGIESTVTLR